MCSSPLTLPMHEYDVTLKLLLRGPTTMAFEAFAGSQVQKWLDIELPRVQNPRMDLLGELADGTLLHLELQSGNDAEMPVGMAEYAIGTYRLFRQFPRQIVLYVGEPALRMQPSLMGPRFSFSYELRDLRDLDGEELLTSEQVGDNILAVLARLRDQKSAVTQIVRRIAGLEATQRDTALSQLLILAGLRGLETTVEQEIKTMPILLDIMDHKVLGREYKRGVLEGEQQGELKILRRMMTKRFGVMPGWAEERISGNSAAELEALSVRLLDALSVEDLLRQA